MASILLLPETRPPSGTKNRHGEAWDISEPHEPQADRPDEPLVLAWINAFSALVCIAAYGAALWYLGGLLLDALCRVNYRCFLGPLPPGF